MEEISTSKRKVKAHLRTRELPKERGALSGACLKSGPEGIFLSDMKGDSFHGNRDGIHIIGHGRTDNRGPEIR